jgi:hypothetical protein
MQSRPASAPPGRVSPQGGGSEMRAASITSVRILTGLVPTWHVCPCHCPFTWERVPDLAYLIPIFEHLFYHFGAPVVILSLRRAILFAHALAPIRRIRQRHTRRNERRGDEKAPKKLRRHVFPTFRMSPDRSNSRVAEPGALETGGSISDGVKILVQPIVVFIVKLAQRSGIRAPPQTEGRDSRLSPPHSTA